MGLSTLLSLALLCLLSAGAEEECVNVTVGTTEVIRHGYRSVGLLSNRDAFHVRWTHNSGIVYDSKRQVKKSRVRVSITAEFYLRLENLQMEDAGTYEVIIYREADGVQLKNTKTRLCVIMPAVSKPRVTHNCSGDSARLWCDVGKDVNARVSWRRNGQPLPDHAGAALSVDAAQLEPGERYACVVKNSVSEEKSDDVKLECPVMWLGLDLWVMVGILAGGGLLVFILLIITSVCLCRSFRHHKEHLDEEKELRLAPLTKPSRQASLRLQPPPPRPKGRARPQKRASIQATHNCRPQAATRPQNQPPAEAQPQPMPRRTAPRTNRS